VATTSILQFSPNDIGTNLLTDAAYLAASDRSNGNQPGVASAKLNNKALRQATLMAAGLAQYLADQQATNVVDTLTPAQISAMLKAGIKGVLLNIQTFASGATVYTPTAGTRMIEVEMVGGGAAGAGTPAVAGGSSIAFGGGGSAGSYARGLFFSGFSGVTVTVGTGGVGVANSAGGAGGTSSLGALMTAPGGVIGTVAPVLTPGTTPTFSGGTGAPGVPTGANLIASRGGYGTYGIFLSGPTSYATGPGGSSAFGAGAPPVVGGGGPTPGLAAQSPGAGGSGALTTGGGTAQAGGNGANGLVIIREYA